MKNTKTSPMRWANTTGEITPDHIFEANILYTLGGKDDEYIIANGQGIVATFPVEKYAQAVLVSNALQHYDRLLMSSGWKRWMLRRLGVLE